MSLYERLAGLRPANRTAAIVTQSRGESWDKGEEFDQVHSDTPLEIKPRPVEAKDLAGLKFGRLTVLGYYGSGARGSLWVVRCVCGAYETRAGRTIVRAYHSNSSGDRCRACVRLRDIQLVGSSVKRMKKAV
jgi:hypothetical protein